MKPIVAIIGKPNVGKSTFFNCLIGKNLAIVSEIAGTTRDRIYTPARVGTLDIILVDTGGLQYGKKENIEADVHTQALLAMAEADLIIFLVDGSAVLSLSDDEAIKELRKKKKEVIFVANKTDRAISSTVLPELYQCGFGKPLEISAIHGRNIEEVRRVIEKKLRKKGFKKEIKKAQQAISVTILGRPNVGKSSLVNALLGQKKIIVSELPGTTRDAIDTELIFKRNTFHIIDTAGLRRRGKIGKKIEYWSILRGFRALERSDIAILLLDATEGLVKQDQHIAGFILEEKKGLILALNKIDTIEDEDERNKILRRIERNMTFLPWAPIVFVSALTSENITVLLDLALQIAEERKKKISEQNLKEFIQEIQLYHSPKTSKYRHARMKDIKQVKTDPPTFVLTVTEPEAFHFSYRRYIERKLREQFGFQGTSISLIFEKNRTRDMLKNTRTSL